MLFTKGYCFNVLHDTEALQMQQVGTFENILRDC